MMDDSYNLIDEGFIPVAGKGRASLKAVFTDPSLKSLGGSPVRKISVLKLLCAIAQAACTPQDKKEWLALGAKGMGEKCAGYLEQYRDRFFLYGKRPFLQIPKCDKAVLKTYGTIIPEVASGNTTLFSQWQMEPYIDDAEKALLLLEQLCFCMSGKKQDHSVVLSKGYEKKASAPSGPAAGSFGMLHSFLTGASIMETVWLNLLTKKEIAGNALWTEGVGVPPWEKMPEGEADDVAEKLKSSLIGRLVPMARFILLCDDGIRFTDGVQHPDYSVGMCDPSAAILTSDKKNRVIWSNVEQKPWRQLTSLLSFLDAQQAGKGFLCRYLKDGIGRVIGSGLDAVGVWSGGMRTSNQAGEQYLTGKDDVVESEVMLEVASLDGSEWFNAFSRGVSLIENGAVNLKKCIARYYKTLGSADCGGKADEAAGYFWQFVEPTFQELVDNCEDDDAMQELFRRYLGFIQSAYDRICPEGTGREFEAKVKNRPEGMGIFKKQAKEKEVKNG